MGDNPPGDLSAAEIELLIDGLSDDVSFDWALIDLGLRANPPEDDVPPNAAMISAAFACFERLLRGGLIEVGRTEYVDPSLTSGTLAPLRHVSEPLNVVRDRVESACKAANEWSDWAFSCWLVNTDAGHQAARHALARRA